MQSKRLNRPLVALAVAVTLLLTTPVLAAPPAAGGASWAGFPGLDVLWARVAGAFGVWFGANGEIYDPNGLAAESSRRNVAPTSMDRNFGATGEVYDPDGSPATTSTWDGEPPSSDGPSPRWKNPDR